jgi:hypothetical protein
MIFINLPPRPVTGIALLFFFFLLKKYLGSRGIDFLRVIKKITG